MYEQAIQRTQKTPAAAAARLECVSKEHRQEMDRRALTALVLKSTSAGFCSLFSSCKKCRERKEGIIVARMLIVSTHGSEDPTRAGVAFVMAKGRYQTSMGEPQGPVFYF